MAEAQPSGVRLAFRTRATWVRLDTIPTKQAYVGAPPRPGGYELVVDGRPTAQATAVGGDTLTLGMATGAASVSPGQPARVEFSGLPEQEKDVEVWLPWNERTELVSLRTDAPVDPLPDRGNLGFSGSALLDPFVARVIRDTAADLISLKIRHQRGEFPT